MTRESASVFAYRALRADGSETHGRLNAPSRSAALERLSLLGLLATDLREARARAAGATRLPLADAAQLFAMLAALLDAGLPIGRALTVLARSAPRSCRGAVESVGRALPHGVGFAGGCQQLGLVAPDVLALLRAGEASGSMAGCVRRAAQLLDERATARRALRSALAYPALLLTASVASIALLTVVVLPRFALILADLGQELPPVTRVVLGAAGLARVAWLPAAVCIGVLAAVFSRTITTAHGRSILHALLLRLPLLGAYRLRAASARVCTTLAALLDAGVPLAPAIRLAAEAGGDVEIERRLRAVRQLVLDGGSVSHAIMAHTALSREAAEMVAAGEESGRLSEMLAHAGRLDATRASALLSGSLAVLEPALIIGFGVGVAIISAALLQAVYAVRPAA